MHGVLGSDMHYKAKQARVMGVPGTERERGGLPLCLGSCLRIMIQAVRRGGHLGALAFPWWPQGF